MLSACRQVAAWPSTAVRKGSLASLYTVVSVWAMTVAVRGRREGARSPRFPHHARTAAGNARQADVELTRGDSIAGIALLALPDKDCSGRYLGRDEGGREAFQCGGGQFGEQRDRAQQGDLHDRDGRMGVQAEQRTPAAGGGKWQHDRDAKQGESAAPQVREQWHQQRAQREPGHGEPFEEAEYLSQ
jgi:hypothetical protein